MRLFLISVFCSIALALPAQAQEFGRADEVIARGTAYHVFTRPGEATIQVLVLGSIGAAGIYEVSVGTDLAELFALARGSVVGVTTTTEYQDMYLRLYRKQGDIRVLIYEKKADEMVTIGGFPELQEGDMLTVETIARARFTWRTALQIVTTVSVLILTVERLSRLL